MVNAAFGPYHIYRADEMPWLKAILVQTNEPTGPFGAKAIAEIPKDGVAPAIANAMCSTPPGRLRRIPFTPQRVYDVMKEV
jgi:putative selenate reductase molybdopterin-binding subunit